MEVSFRLRYHPLVVRRDIPSLDSAWRKRIKHTIEQRLARAPDVYGIPLRRDLHGHFKLRVGDYRVVFRVKKKDVLILAILHRSIVYQHVEKRMS